MFIPVLVLALAGASQVFDDVTRQCRGPTDAGALAAPELPGPCADLRGADLRGADHSGRDLRGARLDGADLTDANLRGADLSGASFRRARLTGAALGGARLVGATLDEADLRRAHLDHARLDDASLRGTNAEQAYVFGASLRRTDLRGARFTTYPGMLHDAPLEGAQVDEATTMPAAPLERLRAGRRGVGPASGPAAGGGQAP